MTSPLARPPLGNHLGKASGAGATDAQPPGDTATTRFLAEIRESMANTEPRRLVWHATGLLPEFTFPRMRARLLAAAGCDVRRGVGVLGQVHLTGPRGSMKNLRIGAGSIIGPRASFCLDAPITIGENVSVGPHVMLYTATHLVGGSSRRMQLNPEARPIVVEDGAWIALGAVILPGVRVGRGAIVGAGAVVSEDVPPDVLVMGNPARVTQELPAT
jgi:acetyltransferase-like isoleucine patch superfamily enzyme